MARVEPRARSIPSSRVRSRTVIERALKTRKAPTKSEVPAKKSSAILNPWSWPLTCWVRVSDRSTCNPSPSSLSSFSLRSETETPSAASTAIPEIWPRLSKASWPKDNGTMPKASPPKDPPGIRKSPTSSSFSGPSGVPTVTLSPIPSPALLAEPPSRVSSLPLRGKCPSVSSKPVARSADRGSTPKRRMLLTSGKSFFCFFEDERGRERIRGARPTLPLRSRAPSLRYPGRTRRCRPPP